MRAWLLLVAVVNPAAVAVALWPRERSRTVLPAVAVAAGVGLVAAALSEPLLEGIDVSRATFQVASAVVVGLAAAYGVLVGPRRVEDEGQLGDGRVLVPLLFPVLVTPQLMMASAWAGAEHGVVIAAAGLLSGLALAGAAALVAPRWKVLWNVAARFVSALAILLALALAVDGVKTI